MTLLESWSAYLRSGEGLTYLARRVRVGARYAVREAERLEAWLQSRAVFNR